MSVEERKEALFQQLDLSGLEGWSVTNQATACALLAKYHNIFSLEPWELGCTDLAKHKIKVTDNGPFKERFWRIPLSMVEEVHTHMKEILEVGTICPDQSQSCNAVVLICKKDRSLSCITFCKMNARMKKDSYPLLRVQEAIKSLVGTGYFSCLDHNG